MFNPKFVATAASRISPHTVLTPLLEASILNDVVSDALGLRNVRVLVKAESLQHTGSFKFRGAMNKLLQLPLEEKERGVVAFSSGNFAQALAFASRIVGVKCTIVAPHDAPQLKMSRTRQYGAAVILSTPREGENREVCAAAVARQFSTDNGATLLHPFDDWEVIYGQGTLALEVFEQFLGNIDALLVPCGGGGMLAGCSLAAQLISPSTKIIGVEPEHYDDHCASFYSDNKERMAVKVQQPTICDALQASAPGELTWEVNKQFLTSMCRLSDADAAGAMQVAFTELKLVLEPSGALGIAALLQNKVDKGLLKDGSCVAVVACGGNVSIENYCRIIS